MTNFTPPGKSYWCNFSFNIIFARPTLAISWILSHFLLARQKYFLKKIKNTIKYFYKTCPMLITYFCSRAITMVVLRNYLIGWWSRLGVDTQGMSEPWIAKLNYGVHEHWQGMVWHCMVWRGMVGIRVWHSGPRNFQFFRWYRRIPGNFPFFERKKNRYRKNLGLNIREAPETNFW